MNKKVIIFLIIAIMALATIILLTQKTHNTTTEPTLTISGYTIKPYQIEGTDYFFIPKGVDISKLKIPNNVQVLQSDVPSICINVDNVTLQEIRAGTKDIKYTATLQVIGANDEKYNITNKTIELKGRGNSTWRYDKKPYQIKFEQPEELLSLNGKAKKWILLANYRDETLLKNQLTYDIQQEIGLSNSIKGMFVDLYINGEFQGNYTLCDKIDIGETRVNLTNKDGLIVEIDTGYGNEEENKFTSKITESIFVIKESVSKEDSEEFKNAVENFETTINQFEECIYAEQPKWEKISQIIDVESFAKYYFLIELAQDKDRFASSTFLYKDGPEDKLHIGPIWDSDISFGAGVRNKIKVDYTLNFKEYHISSKIDWYNQLYRNKEFVNILNETYEKQIKPVYNNLLTKIDEYVKNMPKSIEMKSIRWNEVYNNRPNNKLENLDQKYKENIENLKEWLQGRITYMNTRYTTY